MNNIYIYYILLLSIYHNSSNNTPIINNKVYRKQKMQHALKMKSDE